MRVIWAMRISWVFGVRLWSCCFAEARPQHVPSGGRATPQCAIGIERGQIAWCFVRLCKTAFAGRPKPRTANAPADRVRLVAEGLEQPAGLAVVAVEVLEDDVVNPVRLERGGRAAQHARFIAFHINLQNFRRLA